MSLAIGKLAFKGLSKFQKHANVLQYFDGLSPTPVSIDLVLTLRCNLHCYFCNIEQEHNLALQGVYKERPQLTLDEWKATIDDIASAFWLRPNLHLLGGEPSLYKGYLELAERIKRHGMTCSYVTNGFLLEKHAEQIVEIGVDNIYTSIDGPPAIHDKIRGEGVFARATEGIKRISEIKKATGVESPRLALASVINGLNYGNLPEMIEVAADLGVSRLTYLHLQFADAERHTHNIDVEALIETLPRLVTRGQELGVEVVFTPALRPEQIRPYYTQEIKTLGTNCISPWLRMSIMPNGDMIPCRNYVVGNVRDGVGPVWNNHLFREYRREITTNGIWQDCERCCRRQYE